MAGWRLLPCSPPPGAERPIASQHRSVLAFMLAAFSGRSGSSPDSLRRIARECMRSEPMVERTIKSVRTKPILSDWQSSRVFFASDIRRTKPILPDWRPGPVSMARKLDERSQPDCGDTPPRCENWKIEKGRRIWRILTGSLPVGLVALGRDALGGNPVLACSHKGLSGILDLWIAAWVACAGGVGIGLLALVHRAGGFHPPCER